MSYNCEFRFPSCCIFTSEKNDESGETEPKYSDVESQSFQLPMCKWEDATESVAQYNPKEIVVHFIPTISGKETHTKHAPFLRNI